jgi:FMN-dependent oxidoreductase (nitrilotriacetate monooxygenase family)
MTSDSRRQIHLAAFLIAGNGAHSHAVWRHPQSRLGGFLDPDYYVDIARALERGKFDLAFFADRLAMSDRFGDSLEVGARYGDQDATRLDPTLVLPLMAGATQRLGLGATRSTTYHHPFNVARTFATLDHLTRGRVAWNVVTSVNEGEARNHGLEAHLEHDARYDAADDFMQAAFALWDSWGADALLLDRQHGLYADPAKIRRAEYRGETYRTRGPLNVPRSPQGHPVIIQAGSSSRGKSFAARWAEVIFVVQPNDDAMRKFYADIKQTAQEAGREEDAIKILAAVMPFVGASRDEANEKLALHNDLVHPLVGLSTMSSHMNFDFASLPLDAPLADLRVQGMQGMLAAVKSLSPDGSMTLREIGRRYGQSVVVPQVAGTAADVADWLEARFQDRGCDGFMISPAHLPGGFDDFVEHVVPELQRRGLFRREYTGRTLREHLRD